MSNVADVVFASSKVKQAGRSTEIFVATQQSAEKDRVDQSRWSAARLRVWRVVTSLAFTLSTSILIALSMVFVVIDVNLGAEKADSPDWVTGCNLGVLVLYFIEMCLRLFAFRMRFFRDCGSIADLVVISIDILVTLVVFIWPMTLQLPVVLARIARIMKMTRAFRMISMFPELNSMMRGMLFASKTIIWGVVMLAVLLCLWSIFAVLFIHPVVTQLESEGYWRALQCDRCPIAFSSVQMAMLTFCQQLVIGENWSQINIPLMERRPETAIFFMSVMVTTTLAALNLFLGVIVERATEARAMTLREQAEKKDQTFRDASRRLYQICQELDSDASGYLTFDELKTGFKTNSEFADLLKVMDIDEGDLEVVFNMLDSDGSGDVEYQEFVEQLHMIKNHEAHTLLVFIKFYVMEIRNKVNHALAPQTGPPRGPRLSMALGLIDDVPKRERTSQSSQHSRHPMVSSEAPPVVWPDIDRELQRLKDIRHEMLELSRLQASRLDAIQHRLTDRPANDDMVAPLLQEGCRGTAPPKQTRTRATGHRAMSPIGSRAMSPAGSRRAGHGDLAPGSPKLGEVFEVPCGKPAHGQEAGCVYEAAFDFVQGGVPVYGTTVV